MPAQPNGFPQPVKHREALMRQKVKRRTFERKERVMRVNAHDPAR